MRSRNPATDELLAEYEETSPPEAERIVREAVTAQRSWRQFEIGERAARVRALAPLLREGSSSFSALIAREMGKPVHEGAAEIEKCARVCEHYADEGPRYLARETIASDASRSYVTFEPLGVVLAIMPWNFPFWQAIRFAAPALVAGNAVLLKHAPNVTGCALAIERLFGQVGSPPGLFRAVILSDERTGELIDHPAVRAVTLTGSTRAGRAVGARAGAALKKTVLELGGSDPYVILEDADLPAAVDACVTGRMINGGQSCIAAKRVVVPASVAPAVEELLVAGMSRFTPGDPLRPGTKLGPLARRDLRDNLDRQVRESVTRGARCLLGGDVPEGPGNFYPPTVLTDVRPGMPAYDEELFGPVAAVLVAKDEADAIRVANDTPYGLGAAVFTRDPVRGEAVARSGLEAGSAFVNDFVRSDPRCRSGGSRAPVGDESSGRRASGSS